MKLEEIVKYCAERGYVRDRSTISKAVKKYLHVMASSGTVTVEMLDGMLAKINKAAKIVKHVETKEPLEKFIIVTHIHGGDTTTISIPFS